MNIREAKTQIKEAVSIYLKKDEYGNYRIPVERQRPVFLIGAPGIGKTAIMEQIAKELNVSLVAYSMTHHTRQSALGLPVIKHKTYQGQQYDVSEYTMSEIIATVYENMEKSGKKEGILFLDEINCVSETLGPSMLQFLQYKTFGSHRIPQGWVVVTAGNPPEYNRSVREFDVVTLDRLKVMEVEPDYETWKRYAEAKGIHKVVLTYLDIHRDDFYHVEMTEEGNTYVTARGWEDLSEAIFLYEESGFPVNETMVGHYIRSRKISTEFSAYYDLFRKYRTDYRIRDILAANEDISIDERAKEAGLDERITLLGLLLEALQPEIRTYVETEDGLKNLLPGLREIKAKAQEDPDADLILELEKYAGDANEALREEEAANGLTPAERRLGCYPIAFAREAGRELVARKPAGALEQFAVVKELFDKRVADLKTKERKIGEELHNLFAFVERNFGDGNEMLILITELTVHRASSRFITEKGCEDYFRHNKKFMLYERNAELTEEINRFRRGEADNENTSQE